MTSPRPDTLKVFTIEQALKLIRRIQTPVMLSGWYVALAGGVLNNGSSTTDLDLVFMPRHFNSNRDVLMGILQMEFGDAGVCTEMPGGLHVTFPACHVEGTIVKP